MPLMPVFISNCGAASVLNDAVNSFIVCSQYIPAFPDIPALYKTLDKNADNAKNILGKLFHESFRSVWMFDRKLGQMIVI